jgi:hypothetical protein
MPLDSLNESIPTYAAHFHFLTTRIATLFYLSAAIRDISSFIFSNLAVKQHNASSNFDPKLKHSAARRLPSLG